MNDEVVVLVTGASTGIGEAIAVHLAEHGYKVYGTSRRKQEIKKPFDWIELDVTDPPTIENAIQEILHKSGKIDVLVNNAGLSMVSAFEDAPFENISQVMDTNFGGVLRMTKAVLPHMRQQNRGRIINISSMAGQIGLPFRSIYSASKFAVEGMTEALRQEMAKFGVQACTLLPGSINTDIAGNRVSFVPEGTPYNPEIDEAHELMNAEVRRGIDRADVARKVKKIIEVRHMKSKYIVAKPFQQLVARLKRYLPAGLFEMMLMNHYNLKRKG